MAAKPPITISRADLERIESVLESSSSKRLPALEQLREELDRALIVEPEEMPPGVVTMNSSATCVDEKTGKEYHFTLVYPSGADIDRNRVSILSPMGSALIGLSEGQSIDWQLPGGRRLTLRVVKVTYQPEAAGEYDR
ncbi:MAG TPA: nucleoside diphosphate kinase regulator [Syntrophales bacterium]|nr:nucleoside diphosphate kinase regulator [Syntrophales bacterium]HOX95559.1 nucleoside diphosphate kinase regulator [Syntrophales bacterium]HPI57464.1 nucleoside diphosphate kinase regulator [Syntrophales bacterium]HPN25679.1 nucleoside diphosphate kinase regulator [Syntrophales bacterium]HQM29489.1 nucleoside diphosphate kinase regulator [Syntrophales bacterium]